jgi:hypothetical protein
MNSSIILTDWAANPKKFNANLEDTSYELMLYSLLYDEILIQDECFTLTQKVTNWYYNKDICTKNTNWGNESEQNGKAILEKLFELGTIKILLFPKHYYIKKELEDLAETNPITARAKFQRESATNSIEPINPSPEQEKLFIFLDGLIRKNPHIGREWGSLTGFDHYSQFRKYLKETLEKDYYKLWINSNFPSLADGKIIFDLQKYIDNPQELINDLKKRGEEPKYHRDIGGMPLFSRTLGYQYSKRYYRKNGNEITKEATDIQALLQSVFAATAGWNEEAIGRYSDVVGEFPYNELGTLSEKEKRDEEKISANIVKTSLRLPRIDTDIVEVIQKVRNSEKCIALRELISKPHENPSHNVIKGYWHEIAEDLALKIPQRNTKFINITSAVSNYGVSTFKTEGETPMVIQTISDLLKIGKNEYHDTNLSRYYTDIEHQRVRNKIEKSLKLRSIALPKPREYEIRNKIIH